MRAKRNPTTTRISRRSLGRLLAAGLVRAFQQIAEAMDGEGDNKANYSYLIHSLDIILISILFYLKWHKSPLCVSPTAGGPGEPINNKSTKLVLRLTVPA